MNFPAYSLSSSHGPGLKRRGDRATGGVGRPVYCAAVDRRKSKVWNYYTQLSETHVECNVCKKQLSFHNSTTTMREHLVRKHSIRDNGPVPTNTIVASISGTLLPPVPQSNFPTNNTITPSTGSTCMLQPVVSLVVKEELQDADVLPESGDAKRARTTCVANSAGGCASNVSSQEQDAAQPSHSGFVQPENNGTSHNFGSSDSSTSGCSSKRANLLTELILEMVFRDLQPLSVVEERGFRLLLGCLEPHYHVPSPTQLGSLLWHRYHVLKQHLKHHLQASLAPRCLALCTERWRSVAGCGVGGGGQLYSTVSAHFVDKDWRLARCVLETRPMPEFEEEAATRGDAQLMDTLREVLSEFRLPESFVFCVVHDTPWASEVTQPGLAQGAQKQQDRQSETAHNFIRPGQAGAQNLPMGWVALHCAGESLKLCVQEGLREEPVRQALGAARRIISHFQHDVHAAAALSHKAEAANKAGAQLLLDDPGRWATAIDMCESLLELKWVVSSVLEEQKAAPNLADHQWRLLQELVPVLKTVRIAASFLSEDTNGPISALMPCLHGVSRLLSQRMSESSCAVAQCVMEKMRLGMEQRWRLREEDVLLGSPAVLSSFLDPRFKELRFLSPHARSKLHDKVKDLLSAQAYVDDGERDNDRVGVEDDEEEITAGPRTDLALGLGDTLSTASVAPLDSPVSCGSAEESDVILLKQQDTVTPATLNAPTQAGDCRLDRGANRVSSGAGLANQPKGDVPMASRERASPVPQSMYDILLGEDPTERMPEIHQQLENYIAEPLCKRSLSPLHWWRAKEHRFPAVARLARKYLAIPATAVPADRAFAPMEASVFQRRATLGPQHLDHVLFLHQNSDYVENLKGGPQDNVSNSSVHSHSTQQTRESLYQSLVSYDNKAWVGGDDL
ncbi:E3 SUMO-protein ligase ZBED1 [Brienomyrus brachyistius]|uniref:E3 SUMO-protein ligase ZBED1 n=1 Tax=Brienomyrus brachyistius TaxID=42636 RepID=UPI0020B35E7E|nr:E3 SUMO-protein ligase ZBED1 [Brienomyrus brachyistius]